MDINHIASKSMDSVRRRPSAGSTVQCRVELEQSTEADQPKLRMKPRPVRPGIEWTVGSRVEAMDSSNKWYSAKLVDIDDGDQTVLVHFDGWNQRYDEWLDMKSARLRPISKCSDRTKQDVHHLKSTAFKVGDIVMARWSDSRMYPAKIQRINASGSYEVVFFDGLKKTVKPLKVQSIPRNIQKKYADAGLLSDIGQLVRNTRRTAAPPCDTSSSVSGSVETPPEVTSSTITKIPSRRHSSSAMQSSGGIVSSALRRKATSFDGTLDQRSIPPKVLETPDNVEDKISHCSDALTSSTRSRRVPDSSGISGELFKRRRLSGTQSSQDTIASDKTSMVTMVTDVVDNPKSEDTEKTDGCQITANVEETSQETYVVESASNVLETVPIACVVASVPCSEAKTTAKLRNNKISYGTEPKIAVTNPLKIALPFVNEVHEDTNFQCSTCEKTFRKKSLLDCHMKYHHGSSGTPSSKVSLGCIRKRSSISVAASAAGSTPARRTHCRINSTPLRRSNVRFTRRRFSSTPVHEEFIQKEPGSPEMSDFSPDVSTSFEQNDSANDSPSTHMSEQSLADEKLVTCRCHQTMEFSELIQCTCCLCYQHVHCLESSEVSCTEKYVCSVCRSPPGIRESARYRYDCDWLYNGQMAKFSFANNEPNGAAKAKIMKATHDLVADVLNVMTVVDSIGREIHVLQQRSEPEFGQWKINLDLPIDCAQIKEQLLPTENCGVIMNGSAHVELTNSANSANLSLNSEEFCSVALVKVEDVKCPSFVATSSTDVIPITTDQCLSSDNGSSESPSSTSTTDQCLSSDNGSSESPSSTSTTDQCLSSDNGSSESPSSTSTADQCLSSDNGSSESPSRTSESRVTGAGLCFEGQKDTLHHGRLELGGSLLVMSNAVQLDPTVAVTVGDEVSIDDPIDEHLVSMKTEEHATLSGIEEIHPAVEDSCSGELKDDETCECNLIEHITTMQDALEEHLSLIEKQVAALEHGEGNGNSSNTDPLRDLARVKKTVHQLITDLTRVNRISMYNN